MKRRFFLGAAALVLAAGGGIAALWQPGLRNGKLTGPARRQLGALALALLDGQLREPELPAHLNAFETSLGNFPPAVQAELQQLMDLLANGAGRALLIGHAGDLAALQREELTALLQAMRVSSLALRQQTYFALRELHGASFYAQPQHWAAIGYPGPPPV
jgi:hypothetical protein